MWEKEVLLGKDYASPPSPTGFHVIYFIPSTAGSGALREARGKKACRIPGPGWGILGRAEPARATMVHVFRCTYTGELWLSHPRDCSSA